MYKLLVISLLFLVGCGKPTFQANKPKEVFDAMPGRNMKQVSAQPLTNGWMYTLTNGGLAMNDPQLTQWMIVVETKGKSKPKRLKTIFPKNCQELTHTKKLEHGFLTWVDILSCPNYGNTNEGLLVVTKAIQGTTKFFGATQYNTIPKYTHKVKSYKALPLSLTQRKIITRFLRDTRIIVRH